MTKQKNRNENICLGRGSVGPAGINRLEEEEGKADRLGVADAFLDEISKVRIMLTNVTTTEI